MPKTNSAPLFMGVYQGATGNTFPSREEAAREMFGRHPRAKKIQVYAVEDLGNGMVSLAGQQPTEHTHEAE